MMSTATFKRCPTGTSLLCLYKPFNHPSDLTYINMRRSPWLQEVRIDPRDGMLSTWVLKAQGIEISWKARVTDSTRGERIAWHSLDGLKNRGSVQFAQVSQAAAPEVKSRSAPSQSSVTLAIEFDVPEFLARAFDNNFIGKFVRERLAADLKRYRMVVLRKRRLQRLEEQQKAA